MTPIGPIRYIALHASATYPSQNIGVEDIRQWHLDRGWHDIGYHFVIRRSGKIEPGRPANKQGAHVGGYNEGNLGVCLVGGLKERTKVPEDNFTPLQWTSLYGVVKNLLEKHPHTVIMGHNGFPGHEARGCPCFDWRAWRQEFYRRVQRERMQWPSHWYDEIDKDLPDDG